MLGLTASLAGAPILLFSLLGGVAADRMDRRKLLLIFPVRPGAQRPDPSTADLGGRDR